MKVRQPVRCGTTGLWLARYEAPDGKIRQAGRFKRKSDAQAAILEAMGRDPREQSGPTLLEFFERWPHRFPRHPRTEATNLHRIQKYILPYLPKEGDFPLVALRRSMLRNAQDELLAQGLSKRTIDHAFSALSTMLRDAVDVEYIDGNPAFGLTVRPSDPRLRPTRTQRKRRAVPLDEIHAFMNAVEPRYRAICWAPALTGTRPGELFVMRREEIDRKLELIYLHQTADRYGRVSDGLKSTHHVAEKELRGRWTLFPQPLIKLVDELPVNLAGWLFVTQRGRIWKHRNFYRDVWEPAQASSGAEFTLYDLRHTFSSRLMAAGIPLAEVAAWMGHSLRAGGAPVNTTTTWYAHATGEFRERALRELYVVFEGGAATATDQREAGAPPNREKK